MRLPSSSMPKFAVGAILILACGRSTSALPPTADAAAGGAVSTVETGGMSGTTNQPDSGNSLIDGSTEAGGAFGTGGRPGTGGIGKGGAPGTVDGLDAGEIARTGGAISVTGGATSTGGATTTGGTFVTGTGGTMALGGTRGPGGGGGQGGATASGGNPGAGGTNGSGGVAGSVAWPPKFFGNIDTRGAARTDFATYWDQFTPENAGKWTSVQSTTTTFNWTSLDAMYKYCEDNNIAFKEHCFIWLS